LVFWEAAFEGLGFTAIEQRAFVNISRMEMVGCDVEAPHFWISALLRKEKRYACCFGRCFCIPIR